MLAPTLLLLALTADAPRQLNCLANRVPPPGYRQQTEVLPETSGSIGAAQELARHKLAETVCQGFPCKSLEAEIVDWAAGKNDGLYCAMAVVEESAVQKWRQTLTTSDMDAKFLAVAQELLGGRKSGNGKVAIILHKVIDNYTPGGDRAEWLRARMGSALSRMDGIATSVAPKAWAGDGVPKGFVAVVSGRVFSRTEGQNEILEVDWEARVTADKGRIEERSATPMLVPAAVVPRSIRPPEAESAALPDHDDVLSVQISSAPGGSVCLGEPTQLYIRSAKDQYVQIYDVYGAEPRKAMLIFPNDDHPSGFIKAGTTVAIGGKCGFQAIPVEGVSTEHFIALGASSPTGFGTLSGLKGYCRVANPKIVLSGDGLPSNVRRAGDGYRVITNECAPFSSRAAQGCADVDPKDVEQIQSAIAEIPFCEGKSGPATATDVK